MVKPTTYSAQSPANSPRCRPRPTRSTKRTSSSTFAICACGGLKSAWRSATSSRRRSRACSRPRFAARSSCGLRTWCSTSRGTDKTSCKALSTRWTRTRSRTTWTRLTIATSRHLARKAHRLSSPSTAISSARTVRRKASCSERKFPPRTRRTCASTTTTSHSRVTIGQSRPRSRAVAFTRWSR